MAPGRAGGWPPRRWPRPCSPPSHLRWPAGGGARRVRIRMSDERQMNQDRGMPRVSVVMAVRDAERFVNAAVDSVLAQTFRDFELSIVDDGSSDSTPHLLARYSDPRVQVLRNEQNQGLAAALNRGIEQTRGAYIARMDADDEALPERLSTQVDFLDRHPEIGILGAGFKKIDAESHHKGTVSWPSEDVAIRWMILLTAPFLHSSVMMRSEILDKHELKYDESYRTAQDYELTVTYGFLASLLIFAVFRLRPKWGAWLLAAGFLATVFAMPIAANNLDRLIELKVPESRFSTPYENLRTRFKIWDFVGKRIAEKPLVGWGMNASRSIPGGSDTLPHLTDPSPHMRISILPLHPHNVVLQWWLELGLIGAAIAAAAIISLVLGMTRWIKNNEVLAAGLALLAVVGAVSFMSYGAW
ncbi:MAG TPA: glycosyltransferase, partial [Phycisphaerales bacterium]|nr:glycosyltransferase [Phycisphaerales bacterium]